MLAPIYNSPQTINKTSTTAHKTTISKKKSIPMTDDFCNWERIDQEIKACYALAGNNRNKRRECVFQYNETLKQCNNVLETPADKLQQTKRKIMRKKPPVSYERLRWLLLQKPALQQQLSHIYQAFTNCCNRLNDPLTHASCLDTFINEMSAWTTSINLYEFNELEKHIRAHLYDRTFIVALFQLLLKQE